MFIAFDKIVQPSFFNSGSTNNNQTDDRDGNFQIKNKLANRSPHYPRPNILLLKLIFGKFCRSGLTLSMSQ